MKTFKYHDLLSRGNGGPNDTLTAVISGHDAIMTAPFARLLDVLRAKGILTGEDVCDVLGERWSPASSDMPPPWGTP